MRELSAQRVVVMRSNSFIVLFTGEARKFCKARRGQAPRTRAVNLRLAAPRLLKTLPHSSKAPRSVYTALRVRQCPSINRDR